MDLSSEIKMINLAVFYLKKDAADNQLLEEIKRLGFKTVYFNETDVMVTLQHPSSLQIEKFLEKVRNSQIHDKFLWNPPTDMPSHVQSDADSMYNMDTESNGGNISPYYTYENERDSLSVSEGKRLKKISMLHQSNQTKFESSDRDDAEQEQKFCQNSISKDFNRNNIEENSDDTSIFGNFKEELGDESFKMVSSETMSPCKPLLQREVRDSDFQNRAASDSEFRSHQMKSSTTNPSPIAMPRHSSDSLSPGKEKESNLQNDLSSNSDDVPNQSHLSTNPLQTNMSMQFETNADESMTNKVDIHDQRKSGKSSDDLTNAHQSKQSSSSLSADEKRELRLKHTSNSHLNNGDGSQTTESFATNSLQISALSQQCEGAHAYGMRYENDNVMRGERSLCSSDLRDDTKSNLGHNEIAKGRDLRLDCDDKGKKKTEKAFEKSKDKAKNTGDVMKSPGKLKQNTETETFEIMDFPEQMFQDVFQKFKHLIGLYEVSTSKTGDKMVRANVRKSKSYNDLITYLKLTAQQTESKSHIAIPEASGMSDNPPELAAGRSDENVLDDSTEKEPLRRNGKPGVESSSNPLRRHTYVDKDTVCYYSNKGSSYDSAERLSSRDCKGSHSEVRSTTDKSRKRISVETTRAHGNNFQDTSDEHIRKAGSSKVSSFAASSGSCRSREYGNTSSTYNYSNVIFKRKYHSLIFHVMASDMTSLHVDAIVCPATKRLDAHHGLSKAISDLAGSVLKESCECFLKRHTSLEVTDVFTSLAGNMSAAQVFHAVGPNYHTSASSFDQELRETLLTCLVLADLKGFLSIAFPFISASTSESFEKGCFKNYLSAVMHFEYLRIRMSGRDYVPSLKYVIFVDKKSSVGENFAFFLEQNWEKFGSSLTPNAYDEMIFKSIIDIYSRERNTSSSEDKATTIGIISKLHKKRRQRQNSDAEPEATDSQCLICCEKEADTTFSCCHQMICHDCKKKSDRCPYCKKIFRILKGVQPEGNMTVTLEETSLQGFDRTKTYVIHYYFPSGLQGAKHPTPGLSYHSTSRVAYIPKTQEGYNALQRLFLAFRRGLTFTVGTSLTTRKENSIVWNGIHHKTSLKSSRSSYSFPDPGYFRRLDDELTDVGVTFDSMTLEEEHALHDFMKTLHSHKYASLSTRPTIKQDFSALFKTS